MKILAAELVAAAAHPAEIPKARGREVALLGRSNVGKSSLLNRLVHRKRLARTSRTPGKTRLAHWYRVERPGGELWLVDLPGYGYARVSRAERQRWKALVESYLDGRGSGSGGRGAASRRPPLRVAVLVQDLRRDLSEDEDLLVAWLAERGIPVLLALTKADKLGPMRRAERVRALARAAVLPAERVIATSAETGIGVPELWRAIDSHL